MNKTIQLKPHIRCFRCDSTLTLNSVLAMEFYFHDLMLECASCHKSLDLWKITRKTISENAFAHEVFALINSHSTVFVLKLDPEHPVSFDLKHYGVPEDSIIVDINFTSNSGEIFPAEILENQPYRSKNNIKHKFTLFPGRKDYNQPISTSTNVSIMVSWIPHTSNDEALFNLIRAFRFYHYRENQSAIIPANVAIEAKISKMLTSFINGFVGNKRTDDFLQNAATYSYKLNVLLPIFTKMKKLPILPEHIRGKLNQLRGYRNDLAHRGMLPDNVSEVDIANCLCAALFSFHYINLIESLLKQ